jgi:hypothetical protein
LNVPDGDTIGTQSRQCAPIGAPGFPVVMCGHRLSILSPRASQTRFLPSSLAECSALFAASMTSETAFGRGQAGFLRCLMASVDTSHTDAATVLVRHPSFALTHGKQTRFCRHLTETSLPVLSTLSMFITCRKRRARRVRGKKRLAQDAVASATTSARPTRRIDPVRTACQCQEIRTSPLGRSRLTGWHVFSVCLRPTF